MSVNHGSLTWKVIQSYYSSLDCPRSLTCWLMFKYNEHDQLAKLDIDPNGFDGPINFRNAYLATCFLSKATFLSTSFDKKTVAMTKFYEAELACLEINVRGYHHTKFRGVNEWLHSAVIRKIDSILQDFRADEFVELADWGPGVSLDVKGDDTSSVNKFRLEVGITQPLNDFVSKFIALAYPIWDLSKRETRLGNKVVTVPKNSKTDRTIAIEPGINLWFQKAMGNAIGNRLLRVGIDLTKQERNQRLCRLGSQNNILATVDFSSASDTIAYSTVEALLPPRWFTLLDLVRSVYGHVSKAPFRYESFPLWGMVLLFSLRL